jgi:predicted N-acyltransferase
MALGFIVFWPLGFLMLAYILWGDRIPEIRRHFEGAAADAKREWSGFGSRATGRYGFANSGNAAFDEYRERELKRLDEERRKLEEERREFEAYASDLRRARDKEEFDRFMRERSSRKSGGETIDL